MKFSPLVLCLAIGLMCSISSKACGQGDAYLSARMAARRSLELAKMELRFYLQVEYPRQRRQLDAQIALAEEEVQVYKARQREYEPFMRWSTGRPFSITVQENRLCLMDTEFRLRDLIADRNALQRFRSDEWRLLELNVEEARAQVAAIEGSGVAMSGPVGR